METQHRARGIKRFIILIPHRDALKPLDDYRSRLFAAGFCGAFSFPAAAPLAMVSMPFDREELKGLSGNIRKLSAAANGKIRSAGTAFAGTFFGPALYLSADEGEFRALFPETAKDKLVRVFFPPVVCASIVESGLLSDGTSRSGGNPILNEAPELSFRAAALANLAIRPLAGGEADYSFEWKIGPAVWLPKYMKKGSGNGD